MAMKRLTAVISATALTLSALVAPTAAANDIQYYTARNGVTIPVFKTADGNEGTLVFLNGDGTRRYTTPDGHFIQKITEEVKNENVDSLFLLPPNNQDSWWRTRDVDSWCGAVREVPEHAADPGYRGRRILRWRRVHRPSPDARRHHLGARQHLFHHDRWRQHRRLLR